MSAERPRKRGGRREPPGGAPVKGNVRLVCYVQPHTRAEIDKIAEQEGLTLGQVVDRLVKTDQEQRTRAQGKGTVG